jgi:hypothetical protein
MFIKEWVREEDWSKLLKEGGDSISRVIRCNLV